MAQNVHDLSPKQISAVEALAAGQSHRQAAKTAGVSSRQLTRWKDQEEFKAAITQAKRDVYAAAIARIVDAMASATKTLVDICEDRNAAAQSRVSASRAIVEAALKAYGQEELTIRVEAMEELLKDDGTGATAQEN